MYIVHKNILKWCLFMYLFIHKKIRNPEIPLNLGTGTNSSASTRHTTPVMGSVLEYPTRCAGVFGFGDIANRTAITLQRRESGLCSQHAAAWCQDFCLHIALRAMLRAPSKSFNETHDKFAAMRPKMKMQSY